MSVANQLRVYFDILTISCADPIEFYWHAYNFMQCMEAIIYHVAAGRIDKDLLERIITCYMANEDYPEDLKLEIIHAIDN